MFTRELDRTVTAKRIYFWNAMGSICNAASSILLLLVVTRLTGEVAGGIFSIGFALAQQMLSVASFETSTYQVTDGKNVFGFSTYLSSRICLYGLSVLLGTAVALCSGYSAYKVLVVVMMCLYKGLDAFNATFGAALQKHGRLDIGGKSFALRIIFSVALFTATLAMTKNLIAACLVALCFSVVWVVFYEMHYASFFETIRLDGSARRNLRLLYECLPLFLGSFLMLLISTVPKYAIDGMLQNETLNTAFGIIFMPSSVISLLSIFIYRPALTSLTDLWNERNIRLFCGRIARLSAFVAGATVLCIAGAYLFGIPVLSLLYGVQLDSYRTALCITMAGGGMYAFSNLIYNCIVIFRKQRLMMAAYGVSALLSLCVTYPLVKSAGITGAAWAYFLCTAVLSCSMLALFACVVFHEQKNGGKKNV